MLLFVLLSSRFTCSIKMEVDDPEAEEPSSESNVKINFASVSAGAVVLEKCKASKGYGNLLSDDKDKYGIAPCSEKKWLIIGLSEDVLVRTLVMENYEKYSSLLHEFQVLGSTSYPSSSWHDFGVYAAEARLGAQEFNLTTPAWARYLKFRFLSQHGSEFYCTLSQIKVYGSTVLETFKREVEISELEMLNMRNSIQMETELHAAPSAEHAPNQDEETKVLPPAEGEAAGESATREVSGEEQVVVAADGRAGIAANGNVVSKAADALDVVRSAVLTPLMSVLAHNVSSDRSADPPLTGPAADGGDLEGLVQDIATGLPPVEDSLAAALAANGSLSEEVDVSGSTSSEDVVPAVVQATPLSSNSVEGGGSEDESPPEGAKIESHSEESLRSVQSSSNSTEPLSTEKPLAADTTEPIPSSPENPDDNSTAISHSLSNTSAEGNISTQGNNASSNSTANVSSTGLTSTNNSSEESALKRSADLNCIDILKYSAFKARMLSKISIDVEKNAVTSQDNVFKLLMQKIKVLETNTAIMELYASQLYECYRQHAINMTISLDIQNDTRRVNRTVEYKVFAQVYFFHLLCLHDLWNRNSPWRRAISFHTWFTPLLCLLLRYSLPCLSAVVGSAR